MLTYVTLAAKRIGCLISHYSFYIHLATIVYSESCLSDINNVGFVETNCADWMCFVPVVSIQDRSSAASLDGTFDA